LIAQALLSLDELLPAIKSAEEVIRIAPGWADGYVTLARAQREFGEPELALDNLKMARSIFHKRSSNENHDLFEEYPSHPFDSSLEEIQLELLEIEGIVVRLEERRRQYLLKQEEKGATTKTSSFCVHKMEVCQICTTQPENAEIQDHQLRRCLHNLSGRVRVVKDVNVPHDGGNHEDPTIT
jgi:tetratricopeptide (TPR) repeat protein